MRVHIAAGAQCNVCARKCVRAALLASVRVCSATA
jgi:hypothetical protein